MDIRLSKKRSFEQKITRSLLQKLIVEVITYTFLLLVAVVLAYAIVQMRTWYYQDPLYHLLLTIYGYKEIILIFIWFLGVGVLIFRKFKQLANYLEQLAKASKELVTQDDSLIQLPEELTEIEQYMNEMKRSSLRNAMAAREAEQRKNDLVVYLAHDLKTPLTSVIGYLSLLHDEKQISEEVRDKYLNVALDRAERLEQLINEFFEITRFNLTHQPLEYQHVNFSRMMEQIVYEFVVLFDKKQLSYSLQMDEGIELFCDVNKIERVIDNLIRNAINYSFPETCIEIKAKREEDHVNILIRNHGITIPEEKLQRIFEEFFRLDSSRTSSTGGSGLGLAIAKQIVEQHRGTINAYSKDEIIEFRVMLPIGSK